MTQYIDKNKIKEEIEKRRGKNARNKLNLAAAFEDNYLLSFLENLEAKEVDLDYIKKELDELIRIHKPNGDFGWGTLYNVATHFFELGLGVQLPVFIYKPSSHNLAFEFGLKAQKGE